jgi:hypothetical protein
MSADVTQILSEKGNIIFKSAAGDILKIMPSQDTFAHPSAAPNINIIQFNNSPDRLPSNESFYIKVDQITTPAGPWTQQTLLQELQDNYINTPITVEGLIDLATEITLAAIKSQTDLLTFTGPDLNVSASISFPAGVQRPIELIEATVNGSTIAGVQSVSLAFDGKDGTLDGVTVPDKYIASYGPNGLTDTVGSIAYTMPTNKGQRVLISYVKVS